jgi:hypothetical protein
MSLTKVTKRLKRFHGAMVVTRLEEWCVDAETAAEAKELLAGGEGHRCQLGDCLHVELVEMKDVS